MLTIKDLVRIALFAALIAALGLIPKFDLPFTAGVPITAQTLGVMLAGLILGPRSGLLAVLLFLFVVALGAPVLSGGRGGLGVFFGPTVGFLAGWVIGAWLCGAVFFWLIRRWPARGFPAAFVSAILGGILAVYALGIPMLAFVATMPLDKAALVSLVFVPGDLMKALIAAWLVVRLRRAGVRPG